MIRGKCVAAALCHAGVFTPSKITNNGTLLAHRRPEGKLVLKTCLRVRTLLVKAVTGRKQYVHFLGRKLVSEGYLRRRSHATAIAERC